MNIALDFDGTFTEDPEGWHKFIDLMLKRGHNVMCVTMRYGQPSEMVEAYTALMGKIPIFCTDRKAKRQYMQEQGIKIDVWIDDMPDFILYDARK